MAILEKVVEMKKRGISDIQIINILKENGISPREIHEAISQSNIKMSLNKNPQTTNSPEEYNDFQGEQSIMSKESPQNYPQQSAPYPEQAAPSPYDTPAPYPTPENEETPAYPEAYQEYYPQYSEQGQSQEQGQGYPEYQPPQSLDIETINDIAEQIVEEKNEQIKKQLSSFNSFKEEIKMNIERIEQRLEKLENLFNELQMAILKRIGDYGEDIQNISKEMHETQNSFSKMLDPLSENINRLRELTGEEPRKSQSKESKQEEKKENSESRKTFKKQKNSFEHYLR